MVENLIQVTIMQLTANYLLTVDYQYRPLSLVHHQRALSRPGIRPFESMDRNRVIGPSSAAS